MSLYLIHLCVSETVLSLSFLLSAPKWDSFVCSAHTHPGSPAVGVLWTTLRTSGEPFTWPTCALRASQAAPSAPHWTSYLWTFVSGCVAVAHVRPWSDVKSLKVLWSCTHYMPSCPLSEARPSIICVGPTGGGTGDDDGGHLEFPNLLEVSRQLL